MKSFSKFFICSLIVAFTFLILFSIEVYADVIKDLTATPLNENTVYLSWTGVETTPSGSTIVDYIIRYKEASSEDFIIFQDGVSTNPYATVTGLKKGTTYDFRVTAIDSHGVVNSQVATATTPKIGKTVNPPPEILGLGFYEIVFYNKTSQPEIVQNKFSDYFPYSSYSDTLDFQNYGELGKFRKEGFYVFTSERTTTIHTFFGQTDRPIQIQVRLQGYEESSHVQTVVLYTNIRDKTSDKDFSDAYIVFDRYQPIEVVDKEHLFKEVKAKESLEDGEYWAIFDIVFAKSMQKSDIIIEAWDENRIPVSEKIINAWEIDEPPKQLEQKTISIPDEAASVTCKKTNSCFLPSELQVHEGNTVTWKNDDSFIHSVTSGTPKDGPDNRFRKVLYPQETFEYTFCCSGTYKYYCEIHPWATGMVLVSSTEKESFQDYLSHDQFVVKGYTAYGSLQIEHNDILGQEEILHIVDISGNVRTQFSVPVDMQITKPDGQIVIQRLQTDENGNYSTSINLGDEWQFGSYNISVKRGGTLIGSISFSVAKT